MQQDPNGTGQVVLDVAAMQGGTLFPSAALPSAGAMFTDGLHLAGYVGSSPVLRSDELGLSWDPFEAIEEAAVEHQVSGLFAMAKVNAYLSDKKLLRRLRAYERAGFALMDLIWDRDIGILFSMVGGPFTAHICFVEGTAVTTADGARAIETLSLGDTVVSREDPMHGADDASTLLRERGPVSLVRLRFVHGDGATTSMNLLRPTSLVERLGIRAGDHVPFVLNEMGVAGEAEVLGVEAWDGELRRDVPVVTGTFVTDAAAVVDLTLEGYKGAIGATPRHPLFSLCRGTWTACGDLEPGEQLATMGGEAVVSRVEPRAAPAAVYNVEVSRWHTYFVGEAGVWAHNPCEFVPRQVVKTSRTGGVAYLSPNGVAYVGAHHGPLANELVKRGVWASTKPPAGWFVGIVNSAGKFIGDLIK